MAKMSLQSWLSHFSFSRFPFDRPEAGNDEFARPAFLADCFVEPEIFSRLLGDPSLPVSSILFASRGAGKTSLRVMIDYYCTTGNIPLVLNKPDASQEFVLSVPHINLQEVVRSLSNNSGKQSVIEAHAHEILKRAVVSLENFIAKKYIALPFENLPRAQLLEIRRLIDLYDDYLSASQAKSFYDLGLLYVDTLEEWEKSWISKQSGLSHLENLSRFAELIPHIGIQSTYVLVDGVDELLETAADPKTAYELIQPLLASLKLMDGINHFSLKFFLPDYLEKFVYEDDTVRKDRGFVFYSLRWDKDGLLKILNRRLGALLTDLDNNPYATEMKFARLCQADIGESIENDIVVVCNNNPRWLLVFCGLMVSAHLDKDWSNTQQDEYLLNRLDFETALDLFYSTVAKNVISLDEQIDIEGLIKQQENERLEFKSSMRYDYRNQRVDSKLIPPIIARALAGLMNREGGNLIIGVDDHGEVLGIEKDWESLSKKNVDGFQLAFRDMVKTYLGLEFMEYIKLNFKQLDNHTICVAFVTRSKMPVYFDGKEFYVRFGNTTSALDGAKMVAYINSHWNKQA